MPRVNSVIAASLVFFVGVSTTTNVAFAAKKQPLEVRDRDQDGILDDEEPASKPASMPVEEKARRAAKEAELRPIIPRAKDITKPAYQLYWETDIPLVAIGGALSLGRLVRTQSAYCSPLCDPADINPLDRITAGYYSKEWGLATDVGMYTLMGAPLLFLLIDEGFLPGLNDMVVVAEAALTATALASVATLAAGRPRPLLYGELAPLSSRTGANSGLSFLSSHAAVSFALAVSFYMTMRRLHPDKMGLQIASLVVGLSIASFVAIGRVMAGAHFITDILGGSLIGAAVGVLVPSLHQSPIKVLPKVTPQKSEVTGETNGAVVGVVGFF